MPALDNNSIFGTINLIEFWSVTLSKRLVVWLLLGILPWLSLQTQAGMSTSQQSLEHEILHIGHQAHHHEINGDIHIDSSNESTQHLAEHDCCAHQFSLSPEFLLLKLAPIHSQMYVQILNHLIPNPTLNQLQKPPKLG